MSPPVSEPLSFPRGVRFPRPDEIPASREVEVTRKLAGVDIRTGYLVKPGKRGAFAVLIEANVHAHDVWRVVRALAEALLPQVAAPLIGIKGEKTVLGPYTDRDAALAVFDPYVEDLQHDGFLEFGIMFQTNGRTEEVFVRSAKYLQIWTNQTQTARATLEAHGVPHSTELQFIDEFPSVRERLTGEDGTGGWPTVLEGLKAAFELLPVRRPP